MGNGGVERHSISKSFLIISVWKKKKKQFYPPTLLLGMWIGIVTVENSMEAPQKTKNRVTIWSSNLTSGHISRQNSNLKRHMHLTGHSSTIHNSQDMETTQMCIGRWMYKKYVVHIYNGELLSRKKKEMPFAATWMDLETITLSKVSQKDNYHMISPICVI